MSPIDSNARDLDVRDTLAAAWPLFKRSWPSCLPLALLGVCATAMPGAESLASGEGRGLTHSAGWWGLYLASSLLTLTCYGGVLLKQLALAGGTPQRAFDALRRSLLLLPASALCALLTTLAMTFGIVLLVLPGLAASVWFSFAWIAVLWERRGPVEAFRRSVALIRGHFFKLAGVYLAALAGVLVFVLLAGIFFGVVMVVAGGSPTDNAVKLSRLLLTGLLSLPVLYLSAVLVTCYRTLLPREPAVSNT